MSALTGSIDYYTASQSQAERAGEQRVPAPPRRVESDTSTQQTTSGSATSKNPVDLNQFENFLALLKRELSPAEFQENVRQTTASRSLDEIAAEVRSGRYAVDAKATAARLNKLERLLR